MTDARKSEILKTQTIVGRPVISLLGEDLGTIARVVVDPDKAAVVGLTLNVKGWFKGEKALEFADVKAFGDYAITVEGADRVVPLTNLPTLEKIAQDYSMHGMRIITPEGKLVGTVDDFYFNTVTGEIEKYVLSGGIIRNLYKGRASIPSSSVQRIGKDVIISVSEIEKTIDKESEGLEDNLGSIKSDVGQWKDDLGQWKDDLSQWKGDFEKIWDSTRSRVLDISKAVGDNLIEAAKTGKGKGKDILSKTGEVIAEKRKDLKVSYEYWMERVQSVRSGSAEALSEDDINRLVGFKAGQTVTDEDGNIIIAANETVTETTLDKAKKARRVKELLISVAARDLHDQMNSIEKESEAQVD